MRLIFKASSLIPVKRIVHRGGRTHVQTYYVRPAQEVGEYGGQAAEALRFTPPPPPVYPPTAGGRARERLDRLEEQFNREYTAVESEIEQLKGEMECHSRDLFSDERMMDEAETRLAAALRRQEEIIRHYRQEIVRAISAPGAPAAAGVFYDPREAVGLPPLSENDRANVEEGLAFIRNLLSPRALEYFSVSVQPRTPEENPHQRGGVIYVAPEDDPGIVAHEIAHHLHESIPGAAKRVEGFFQRRTAEQSREWMPLPGKMGYWSIPDNFFHPYVGRIYSRYKDGVVHEFYGNEILSMGVEALWQNPISFARKDPEHFDLTLGILHGEEA